MSDVPLTEPHSAAMRDPNRKPDRPFILPGKDYPLADWELQKIKELAQRMYKECYIGHIPEDQWEKFAAFAFFYQRGSIPVG